GWTNIDGELRCFERSGLSWKHHGEEFPIVVGHAGMGWPTPRWIPGNRSYDPPVKREGDGRSPAGVLGLPTAFGYASPEQAHWIKLPYIQCTDAVECVDDGKSSHYNEVL